LKEALKTTFVLVLLASAILFQGSFSAKGESSEKRFTITSTVTYSNNGASVWDLTGEEYAISLFMNNSWQSVSLAEHSLSLNSIGYDTDGNLLGFLNFTSLSPGQSVSYTVKYDVVSRPRLLPNISEEESLFLANISDTLKNEYCRKEGPWLIDDPNLMSLATSLAGNETRVLSIVKNLVSWVANDYNIKYDSAEVPRYPNETLSEQKGDCDDQAILLITLCRILGIPAYLQIGCIFQFGSYSSDTYWEGHVTSVLKQIGWHGWAIVYVSPWGWLPVDLTYVYGGLSDPLNAIRGAAVTSQGVIQYMNFTHSDYVGNSRHLRDFMESSDNFLVYMEDEMKMIVDNTPPVIGIPSQNPLKENVTSYQNVTITVDVTDLGTGVHNVTLWYSIDNGTTWIVLKMNEIATNTYQETIPGYGNCTWVTYMIVAYDNYENSAIEDNYGYYYVYHVIPEFPSFLTLTLFLIATLLTVVAYRRKHQSN